MSSEPEPGVQEIFLEALELDAPEREALLERSCGLDPRRRRAVEELLRAANAGGDFLEEPLIHPPAMPPAPEPPPEGMRLGPYRLLRKIGQGGMGTVYLARRDDETFEREVAIKVLPAGLESEELERRLRLERRILASLEHPWIAAIHDAGSTSEGLPYFVMEYVDGVPIDVYCDERGLGVRERIALFREVCEAVRYAHQNLIVHRDLKPSNILVDRGGEPRLLDFGIAKLLDPESGADEATRTWQRLMTPHYASPEQIQGRALTTASDVYSLGVLLYELLAGQLPHRFEGKSPREIEEALLQHPPPPPSRAAGRRRRIGRDLDAVVLKALRSRPESRYGSVEDLSADLGRVLEGFPVRARRGGLAYRWSKHLRRNALPASLATLALAAAAAFTSTTVRQAERLEAERDLARRERERAEQVTLAFEQVFQMAEAIAPGGELTVGHALDRSVPILTRRLADEPGVRAPLLAMLGRVYLTLGRPEDARRLFEQSLATRRELHGEASPQAALGRSTLATALRELQDFERAEALSREALETVRSDPGADPEIQLAITNHLVTLYCYTERYAEADEPSVRALELAEAPGAPAHAAATALLQRAQVLSKLHDDQPGAEALYRRALARYRHLYGDDHPEVAILHNNLGRSQERQGELAEAIDSYRRALEIQKEMLPGGYDPGLTLTNLAAALQAAGEHAEAEARFREAYETLEASQVPPLGLRPRALLALLLLDLDRSAEVPPLLQSRLAELRPTLPPGHFLVAAAEAALGLALAELGREQEAGALLAASLPAIERARGADDPFVTRGRETLERLERDSEPG